jgi:hypothetical protein
MEKGGKNWGMASIQQTSKFGELLGLSFNGCLKNK